MNFPKPPLSNPRYTGWSDDYHPTPLPIILPVPPKFPSQSGYQIQFKNNPAYGKNYKLIFPDNFVNLPKHQFSFNTPQANQFSDANPMNWIKP
jgi:hypothetical protein